MLLGLSGSVAAIKAPELVAALLQFAEVRVVLTAAAEHFALDLLSSGGEAEADSDAADAAARAPPPASADEGAAAGSVVCGGRVRLYRDADEWGSWRGRGDPVLHIELRKWADVLLIAPLSANTLAKLAAGLCDNLLTCIARAWESSRPVVLAPAMNTAMWEHRLTASHMAELTSAGACVVPPVAKRLACGDTGVGAMAEVHDIAAAARAVAAHAALLTNVRR